MILVADYCGEYRGGPLSVEEYTQAGSGRSLSLLD